MKKIYLTLLSGLFISQLSTAQTLTESFNTPIAGDINNTKAYDSVGVVPKNTGSGLTWNFGSFPQTSNVASSSFSTPASVPSATAFPSATVVENMGGGNYNYWKAATSPTTQLELVGKSETNGAYNYTNSALYYVWPVNFGNTNSDTYGGPLTGAVSGSSNGSITVNASGTGTIILPGGITLSNILQVKITQTVSSAITSPITGSEIAYTTNYLYFHGTQKFPVLNVAYSTSTISIFGPTVQTTAKIWGNTAILTGLNDNNFDATFQIFPNPAKDNFNVNLSNASNENCAIQIYNGLGQLVQNIDLGNEAILEKNISISGLKSGVYIVKTTLGTKTSSRRLIIE